MKHLILACLSLLWLSACSKPAENNPNTDLHNPLPPSHLLAEGNTEPLHVHNQKVRLSWRANVNTQAAYQIQVASTKEGLSAQTPDLWDSGKVLGRRSLNMAYSGKPLQASESAYWRVRVWGESNSQPSDWSIIARWEMGLLENSDWQAQWIQVKAPKVDAPVNAIMQWIELAGTVETEAGGLAQPALELLKQQPTAGLFRHQFSINKTLKKAKLYSTAGGYYEVYINGQRVEDRLMDPGQTDFDKRILYNSDDVTQLMDTGENAVAVHLGSGWYNESIAFSKPDKNLDFGQPAFILQLELTFSDGTKQHVVSDENWKSFASAVRKEGIFSGELYDSNLVIEGWNAKQQPNNSSLWEPVKVLDAWPTQALVPQLLPPIRAKQVIKPVAIFNPKPSVWVFDFGQNFTGIPTLNIANLKLNNDQAIFLKYAEWADKKGNISQLSGGGWATHLNAVDGYVASKNSQATWTPSFTWRGFRYIEITGLEREPTLDDMFAQLTRSDVKRIGTFTSSDALLNRIHETALWSYESNLMSVPMDCPIREKAGWTGDAHAALITANYNYNMQTFWEKYLGDFQTALHIAPAVVPGKRTTGEKIDWAVAEVFIAWEYYRHHGDQQVLESQYKSLLEYMDFGQSQLTQYLTSNGFGDWCDPVKAPGTPRVGGRGTSQYTTTTVTTSALFARAADIMSRIAGVLNKETDQVRFTILFHNIRENFHRQLYDKKTGHYGSQTADAMALRFNITPEPLRQSVADALNKNVVEQWGGHSSVGALGQTWLYRALSDYGYADTAFNIFKAKGYPGFSYLFDELDGTTLWERKGAFDPSAGRAPIRSLNHPFHSGYDGWFYEGLGGIQPFDISVGYQDFALQPVFPKGLNSANVKYETGYGTIESRWERKGNQIHWTAVIPNNTTAVITLPNKKPKLHEPGQYEYIIED